MVDPPTLVVSTYFVKTGNDKTCKKHRSKEALSFRLKYPSNLGVFSCSFLSTRNRNMGRLHVNAAADTSCRGDVRPSDESGRFFHCFNELTWSFHLSDFFCFIPSNSRFGRFFFPGKTSQRTLVESEEDVVSVIASLKEHRFWLMVHNEDPRIFLYSLCI